MTMPRWWAHAARKDVLALASTWIWCAVAMVAARMAFGPAGGFAAYLLGPRCSARSASGTSTAIARCRR